MANKSHFPQVSHDKAELTATDIYDYDGKNVDGFSSIDNFESMKRAHLGTLVILERKL